MAKLLKGTPLAENIKNQIRKIIQDEEDFHPRLDVILIGNDPASEIYVKKKEEACKSVGITSVVHRNIENETDAINLIRFLNTNPYCNGILVQLPLPFGWDETKIFDAINPLKDVDVFSPENIGLLVQNRPRFLPPTPHGIRELIVGNGLSFFGQHVVVINRSNIVGKPLSSMLIQDNGDFANATVTVCHINTPHDRLKQICLTADIIVVAVGIPNFLTADMVKGYQIIIDVGINRVEGKVVGDADPAIMDKVHYITPVPGGVGPLTVAMLLYNTVEAAKLQCGIKL